MLKEYFSFTKKERVAVIALLVVILAAYLIPYFIKPAPHKLTAPTEVKELVAFKNTEEPAQGKELGEWKKNEEHPPAQLFYFDPNNTSTEAWQQLGLRPKTIGTILKYLSKGGRFHEPLDLKKIYGLKEDEYERLESYIRIKPLASKPEYHAAFKEDQGGVQSFNHHPQINYFKRSEANIKSRSPIDINEADTAAFISLPGIGSKLAARIIAFREKLGGFHSISQIAETYGLPDSTFQKILPLLSIHSTQPRTINLNTATIETLKQHPYIRWAIANAIIRYREQHGAFTSIDALQQIEIITPEIYNKLLPYVSLTSE